METGSDGASQQPAGAGSPRRAPGAAPLSGVRGGVPEHVVSAAAAAAAAAAVPRLFSLAAQNCYTAGLRTGNGFPERKWRDIGKKRGDGFWVISKMCGVLKVGQVFGFRLYRELYNLFQIFYEPLF